MTTDLLLRVSGEIDARLHELRPLVAEYERLLAGGKALGPERRASDSSSSSSASRSAAPSAATTQADAKAGTVAAPGRGRSSGRRRTTARAPGRAASTSVAPRGAGSVASERDRAPRGAVQEAIVAALEHGSHTVSELAVVTAMSGASIRQNLRRLLKARVVTPAKRDGKPAYALSGVAER